MKSKSGFGKALAISGIVLWILITVFFAITTIDLFRKSKDVNNTYTEEYLHLNSLLPATFEKKVNNGEDFYALISRPSCFYCREIKDMVISVVEKHSLQDQLYYVNITSIRKSADDPVWVDFKKTYGDIAGTPTFVHVKNGEVVSYMDWPDDADQFSDSMLVNWLKKEGCIT